MLGMLLLAVSVATQACGATDPRMRAHRDGARESLLMSESTISARVEHNLMEYGGDPRTSISLCAEDRTAVVSMRRPPLLRLSWTLVSWREMWASPDWPTACAARREAVLGRLDQQRRRQAGPRVARRQRRD